MELTLMYSHVGATLIIISTSCAWTRQVLIGPNPHVQDNIFSWIEDKNSAPKDIHTIPTKRHFYIKVVGLSSRVYF